ncbi:MAG: carboxymuconolactone decarboxylase family protein [Candidatus Midichloria sp.]|nr:MAG: carboxymuconolactone decarboxylase family protein [Candidatus Midichloria sp.]
MSILGIIKKLPDYAADIKGNLVSIFEEKKVALDQKQLYGVSLAIAYSLKHEQLLNGIRAEAKLYLEDVDANACKIAATMMAMTNTYYKFVERAEDPDYKNMESELNMLSLSSTEVAKEEMDLYCLGVSILNACNYCISVHSKRVLTTGLSKEAIRDIAKIASVLQAAVNALEIERMRSYDFVVRDASMD